MFLVGRLDALTVFTALSILMSFTDGQITNSSNQMTNMIIPSMTGFSTDDTATTHLISSNTFPANASRTASDITTLADPVNDHSFITASPQSSRLESLAEPSAHTQATAEGQMTTAFVYYASAQTPSNAVDNLATFPSSNPLASSSDRSFSASHQTMTTFWPHTGDIIQTASSNLNPQSPTAIISPSSAAHSVSMATAPVIEGTTAMPLEPSSTLTSSSVTPLSSGTSGITSFPSDAYYVTTHLPGDISVATHPPSDTSVIASLPSKTQMTTHAFPNVTSVTTSFPSDTPVTPFPTSIMSPAQSDVPTTVTAMISPSPTTDAMMSTSSVGVLCPDFVQERDRLIKKIEDQDTDVMNLTIAVAVLATALAAIIAIIVVYQIIKYRRSLQPDPEIEEEMEKERKIQRSYFRPQSTFDIVDDDNALRPVSRLPKSNSEQAPLASFGLPPLTADISKGGVMVENDQGKDNYGYELTAGDEQDRRKSKNSESGFENIDLHEYDNTC